MLPRDLSQARRRFVGPFLQAIQGNTAPLDAWLTRLEKKAATGEEHPFLALDAWTHHRPARGDPNAPAALAPLRGLLDADLPLGLKRRAIALTRTLWGRADPATLTKWRLGIGVSETTWLRAWDVPDVQAFARQYLKVFDRQGRAREDWSYSLLNDFLASESHDPSHHAYLTPTRRARVWANACATGMVRDDALIDVRTAAPMGRLPPAVQGLMGATDAHTALEWLLLSDEPNGLVDAWLARNGNTPAWISPATGASLTWVAFAHRSPRLLEHWLDKTPTLLDQPMAKGAWGQRKELSGEHGLVIGGRYVMGSLMADALAGEHGAMLRDWLNQPVVTVRQTLLVLGQVIDPVLRDAAGTHGQVVEPSAWDHWAETFVLCSVLNDTAFGPDVIVPGRGRPRL